MFPLTKLVRTVGGGFRREKVVQTVTWLSDLPKKWFVLATCWSKLYWVDSRHKTLNSVDVEDDRAGRSSVSLGSTVGSGHVYGLAVDDDNNAYISGWNNNVSMIQVSLTSRTTSVYMVGLSGGAVFSNVYVKSSLQPSGSTASFFDVSPLLHKIEYVNDKCSIKILLTTMHLLLVYFKIVFSLYTYINESICQQLMECNCNMREKEKNTNAHTT